MRFLDTELSPLNGVTEFNLKLSEFKGTPLQCDNVLIAENKMNFKNFFPLEKTIAIWSGGGFAVSRFKDVSWLKSKRIFYWGDIDTAGFQILSQFRCYFPNTVAMMMDKKTFSLFKPLLRIGKVTNNQKVNHLTTDALKLHNHVKQTNIRLEQEQIPQAFAEAEIRRYLASPK